MKPSRSTAARQQRRILTQAENADANGFFNLLTGPQLLADVEALLPDHRERLFPPTETLAMFLAQALSADGSCRQVVDRGRRQALDRWHEPLQQQHRGVLQGAGAVAAGDDRGLDPAHRPAGGRRRF